MMVIDTGWTWCCMVTLSQYLWESIKFNGQVQNQAMLKTLLGDRWATTPGIPRLGCWRYTTCSGTLISLILLIYYIFWFEAKSSFSANFVAHVPWLLLLRLQNTWAHAPVMYSWAPTLHMGIEIVLFACRDFFVLDLDDWISTTLHRGPNIFDRFGNALWQKEHMSHMSTPEWFEQFETFRKCSSRSHCIILNILNCARGEEDYVPPPEAFFWIGQVLLGIEHPGSKRSLV